MLSQISPVHILMSSFSEIINNILPFDNCLPKGLDASVFIWICQNFQNVRKISAMFLNKVSYKTINMK
jgi:hypothetical protein